MLNAMTVIMFAILIFSAFIIFREEKVLEWRSKIRQSVNNYNFNKWKSLNNDYSPLDVNDVLLDFGRLENIL